jgi:tetratricopeptide (TPR) repeat protein
MKRFLKQVSFSVIVFVLVLISSELLLRGFGICYNLVQEYENFRSGLTRDTFSILCLGESTTAGGFNSYPQYLQDYLDRRNGSRKARVINKGVMGTTSSMIARRLENYIQQYKPDMIIMMIGINDPKDADHHENSEVSSKWYRDLRIVKFAVTLTELYRAVLWKWSGGPKPEKKHLLDEPEQIDDVANLTREQILGRADHYQNEEDHHAAIALLAKGAELFPRDPNILAYLGALQRWVGKRDEARVTLEKALEIQPDQCQALFELAILYKEIGLDDESFEMRKRIVQSAKTYSPGYLYAAELYLRKEDYANVENTIREGLRYLPENDRLLGALGILYLGQKERGKAEEYFERAAQERERFISEYTRTNYRKIEYIAGQYKIPLVAMQYPVRDGNELRAMFRRPEKVIFVSNAQAFKAAIAKDGYFTYFIDMFGGEFGHCTPKGNMLIAQNLKGVIEDLIR